MASYQDSQSSVVAGTTPKPGSRSLECKKKLDRSRRQEMPFGGVSSSKREEGSGAGIVLGREAMFYRGLCFDAF
jgi:hypothetical protein